MNGDGFVDNADASMVRGVANGTLQPPSDICCMDLHPVMNEDGNVTSNDQTVVQRIVDGVYNSAGTCNNPLDPRYCSNGLTEGAEECDDGNTVGGDGCSTTCTNE